MWYLSDIKSRLAGLNRDEAGNVAILTALVFVPVLVMACGSVDVIRVASAKHRLQALLDSATLAAAALTNTKDMTETADDYVAANTPSGEIWHTLTYTSEILNEHLNAREMKIIGSVDVRTPFLSLIGHAQSTVTAESVAIQSASNIEVSMILDISSSMMTGGKIDDLRIAAKQFVNIMLSGASKNYTSINLILFGGTVNIGNKLFYRYANSINDIETIINPSEEQYNIEEKVLYEKFLFDNGGYCIEYTKSDYNLQDITPLASRPQVPNFAVYRKRNRKWNKWCPEPETESIFNSNNLALLEGRLDSMTSADGTGMDIGAMWGAKALSPDLRGVVGGDFPESRPADFTDTNTLKIAIIMTDGVITSQIRPIDPDHESTVPLYKKKDKQQIIVSMGDKNTPPESDFHSVAYFKRMCDFMRAEGVQVYTIGFQLQSGGLPDYLLKYCASTPSDYYFVEGLNLRDAFNSIAASINSLRISG